MPYAKYNGPFDGLTVHPLEDDAATFEVSAGDVFEVDALTHASLIAQTDFDDAPDATKPKKARKKHPVGESGPELVHLEGEHIHRASDEGDNQ